MNRRLRRLVSSAMLIGVMITTSAAFSVNAVAGGNAGGAAAADPLAEEKARVLRPNKFEGQTLPVSNEMVYLLRPKAGDTVLELAAGLGSTGFLAAPHLGPNGKLISANTTVRMLAATAWLIYDRKLANVEPEGIDAEKITLADESVDGVLCRWGYPLMDRPSLALRETLRVLQPTAPLVLAAWTKSWDNKWMSLLDEALIEHGHLDKSPPQRDPFGWGDPGYLTEQLVDAGFENITRTRFKFDMSYESFEDWFQSSLEKSATFSKKYAQLAEEQQRAVRAHLRASSQAYANSNGRLTFPASTWIVKAHKPIRSLVSVVHKPIRARL